MYTFTSKVRYSEIDESGTLSVTALIKYLQDCSTFHSQTLGLGPAHADATGLAWLISAWEIEISALPHFDDEIRVSTWATEFKGLRAHRNFTVRSADDSETYVRANSEWFMFDAASGRPIRSPKTESEPYLIDARNDAPLDMPPLQRIIRYEGEGVAAAPVTVTGAYLDTNHHVNNANYVSMALGVLPEDIATSVRFLDVRYHRAATLGDVIYPHVHTIDDGSVVTLDDDASKPYALVRVRV